jgi:hypothetical protein
MKKKRKRREQESGDLPETLYPETRGLCAPAILLWGCRVRSPGTFTSEVPVAQGSLLCNPAVSACPTNPRLAVCGSGGRKCAPHFESSWSRLAWRGFDSDWAGLWSTKVRNPSADCGQSQQACPGRPTKPIRCNGPPSRALADRSRKSAKMPTINVDKYALFEELGEQ